MSRKSHAFIGSRGVLKLKYSGIRFFKVIEEEGEDERASSIQSQRDPLTTSVIPEILLPSQEAFKRPPAGSSSDSQSSDEEMEAKEPPVVVAKV